MDEANRERAIGDAAVWAPYWVAGVAAACLVAGHLLAGPLLGLGGKTYDWAIYFLTAAVLPAAVLGLPLAWRREGWPAAVGARAKRTLALAGMAAMAGFIVAAGVRFGPEWLAVALGCATVQTAIAEWGRGDRPRDWRRMAAGWLAGAAGWLALATVGAEVYLTAPVFLAGLAGAVLLIGLAMRGYGGEAARRPGRIADWVAAALIVVMSLRTEHLFEVNGMGGAIHHWGAWVGTADLMRQGAWLLWDAPSNYGFLNVAVFNALPTRTPWQGFWFAQTAAFVIVGLGMYGIVRWGSRGWNGWAFGLLAACVIPMYTRTYEVEGPVTSTFIFPNWGPYRYVCCFALVVWLLLERRTDEESPRYRWVLAGGCALWLVGVLWSTESAWFCTGAWLPAYAVMAVRRGARADNHRVRTALGWLALPAALLAATVLGMEGLWRARVGHGPDWIAMLDYVIGVGTTTLIVKQSLLGPGSIILLGFVLVGMGAAYGGVRAGWPTRSLAVWTGLLGTFAAVSAFGYQRGNWALHPVGYTVLLLALGLLWRGWEPGQQQEPDRDRDKELPDSGRLALAKVVRGGAAPLLTLAFIPALAAVAANPWAAREAAESMVATARHGMSVEWMMPDQDAELQELLRESGVTAETPLLYAGDMLGNLMLPWTPEGAAERTVVNPQWTPGHPVLALRWIPEGRDVPYVERYLERHPKSGWLIQTKTGTGATVNEFGYAGGLTQRGFTEVALRSHVPTMVRQSEDWQITWWELDGGAGARPEFPGGIQRPLPPDVTVDGERLSEAKAPEVWASFGEGWAGLSPERPGGRVGEDGATLWVYSPREETARIEADVARAPGRSVVTVNGSGGAGSEGTASVEVTLRPGWNAVEFGLAPIPREPIGADRDKAADGKGATGNRPKAQGEASHAAATPVVSAAPAAAATAEAGTGQREQSATAERRRFTIADIRIETGQVGGS